MIKSKYQKPLKELLLGLLFSLSLLASTNVQAQGWCWEWKPECMGAINANNNADNNSNSNSNETSSSNSYSYQAPMKASQYGAVAQNPKTGAVGMANRQRSKAKANKEALADCGEAGCKIISSYANTCMVLANATNGFWVIRNGESEILAERLALSVCSENGSDCKVFFSECSLP